MTKKALNQNAKFDQEFINTFEPDFTFSDKPINRFNISSNNTTKNTLDKAEKLFKLKKKLIQSKIVFVRIIQKILFWGMGT